MADESTPDSAMWHWVLGLLIGTLFALISFIYLDQRAQVMDNKANIRALYATIHRLEQRIDRLEYIQTPYHPVPPTPPPQP